MCKLVNILVTLLCFNAANAVAKFDEVFGWSDVTFKWPSESAKNNAIKSGLYVAEHNLPLGLARWRDKLFITVPR